MSNIFSPTTFKGAEIYFLSIYLLLYKTKMKTESFSGLQDGYSFHA